MDDVEKAGWGCLGVIIVVPFIAMILFGLAILSSPPGGNQPDALQSQQAQIDKTEGQHILNVLSRYKGSFYDDKMLDKVCDSIKTLNLSERMLGLFLNFNIPKVQAAAFENTNFSLYSIYSYVATYNSTPDSPLTKIKVSDEALINALEKRQWTLSMLTELQKIASPIIQKKISRMILDGRYVKEMDSK